MKNEYLIPRVIAEIGINHGGNKKKSLKLINYASESGCWGVKFQFRADSFFASNDEMGSTLIRDELKKSNLKSTWINDLIKEAKKLNLKIGFSFFRVEDLKEFNYNIDFIKIPSPEFRNLKLINAAKKRSKQIMISYGGGEEKEIKSFVQESKLRNNDVVFHCISNYPTSAGNQQLDFISRLKGFTSADVGYSSHDKEWEISLFAASLGIKYIERHLCYSKDDKGLDISTSSDLGEFKKLIKLLNNINEIHNCKERKPNQGEILNIRNLGTCLYADKDLKKGYKVSLMDFDEKSPSIGLTIKQFSDIKHPVLKKDILKGEALLKGHFTENNKKIVSKYSEFANKNSISLPVRLHDFISLSNKFNFTNYEFHFSYKEVEYLEKNGFKSLIDSIDKNFNISIHLPDYISKDNLIDPFSEKLSIQSKSRSIIDTSLNLAKEIRKKTKNECLILGSFSVNKFKNKEIFYKNYKLYIDEVLKENGILILAQWLPKKAWYFGGTEIINLFSDLDDIEFCLKNKIPICLDVAHLILSANYFNKDWKQWYNKLLPLCKHIHLSDAEGTDGEGVKFGKGDVHSLNEIIGHNNIKVLEIWEGHINNGEKFYDGLKYLHKEYTLNINKK